MPNAPDVLKENGNSLNKLSYYRLAIALLLVLVIMWVLLFFSGPHEPGTWLSAAEKRALIHKLRNRDGAAETVPSEAFSLPEMSNLFGSEHLDAGGKSAIPTDTQKIMGAMGYGDNSTWEEVIKVSELDPSDFTNHQDFVKDVRRFSSGANFTSVTDDNINWSQTQFVGLRRPQHVDIGASARQQQDVDVSVLKRNKPLYWGYSAGGATYLTAEQNKVPAGQYENNVMNAENFVNW